MKSSSIISDLKSIDKGVQFTILIAALGYFVDAFDLLLFSAVRVASLKSIGVPESDLLSTGVLLINVQMAGLVLGGFLWGILGDKFGRLSVLLGSIFIYSAASFANAFVDTVPAYTVWRFIAGVGLAGELGVGVALASEIMPQRYRGLGTAFIATIGMLGCVCAGLVADLMDWRTAYIVGGVLGFLLLFLRMRMKESNMYLTLAKKPKIKRGSLLVLLKPKPLKRYAAIILVPLPLLVMLWIFVAFTPEFAKALGMTAVVQTGKAIMFAYIGMTIGDAASGIVSQLWHSRKKAIVLFIGMLAAAAFIHLTQNHDSAQMFYASCLLMGITGGYWILVIQMAAEQFGTNLRATVATSVPTMARGALLIPMTMAFKALVPVWGVIYSGAAIMALTLVLALVGLYCLKESFNADLDFVD
ncbi:MAG: MFS transporter [Alphaproteobacteria bacterium]